jgi:hypothetical protein
MHSLMGSYPAIIGTYPNAVTVRVQRADETGYLNTPFAVQIITPAASTRPFTCDGVHDVRAFLSQRQLPLSSADWTVEAATIAGKGGTA